MGYYIGRYVRTAINNEHVVVLKPGEIGARTAQAFGEARHALVLGDLAAEP